MKCLLVGERPGVVDGGWSNWSPWSRCSRTCGSGVTLSVRRCVNPVPSNGGAFCRGDRKRHKICTTEVSSPSHSLQILQRILPEIELASGKCSIFRVVRKWEVRTNVWLWTGIEHRSILESCRLERWKWIIIVLIIVIMIAWRKIGKIGGVESWSDDWKEWQT